MKAFNTFIAVFVLYASVILSATASDLQREQRMADEIIDTILDGDAVFLRADDHEFLAIDTRAEEARGTAIILHGRGFHPDWPDAVNPLRVGLVEAGWNTLSLQMPVLQKQAKYYDYVPLFPEALPRIDAAIAYVHKQHTQPDSKGHGDSIVLIAHSCGAHMAMAWLETQLKTRSTSKQTLPIDAYVGIGMGATDYQQPMRHPFPLDRISVPVLDVYAEYDYPAVLKNAASRFAQIRSAGNPQSAQVMVEQADHYYTDRGDALSDVVSHWLNGLSL